MTGCIFLKYLFYVGQKDELVWCHSKHYPAPWQVLQSRSSEECHIRGIFHLLTNQKIDQFLPSPKKIKLCKIYLSLVKWSSGHLKRKMFLKCYFFSNFPWDRPGSRWWYQEWMFVFSLNFFKPKSWAWLWSKSSLFLLNISKHFPGLTIHF